MSALGKRKEREDEPEQPKVHGSTLFVSNLPYTATSTDLQTLFSDIAPVRSAFVVTEKGSGVSKGVGYVSFAVKEDAKAAYEKLSREGITLDGRGLRVSWADSKNKHKDEKTEKAPKPRPEPRPRAAPSQSDPLAIRTIVIAGLPSSIDSKSLWKKVRKYGGAEKVEWPLKRDDGTEDPTSAHAVFATPAAAQEAVSKLHAHVFKGSLLSVTLKKRLEGLAKATIKRGKAKAGAPVMPSRSSRLIVRNLPFNITEQDLRAVFLPYGPIYSITLPMTEAKEGEQPRPKGFAFVWMLSKKDAEKAMEGCNGLKVRAGMADGIVSDKQKRKKQRREETKARKTAKGDEEEEASDAAEEEEDGKKARERVIAVDWALSKDRWEEEKAKIEEVEDEEDPEEGADSDQSEVESGSESDEGEGPLGVHEDGSDDDESGGSDESGDEDMDVDEQKPAKPTLPPPETGTTLFIRNVPYEATEDELRTLFRTFGPLRYARITMDHATGRPRGTGFVCFWNKEDADKAIQQSEILRAETAGEELPKKNPFKFSSILTPDPSSAMAQSLVLHGRTLDVIRAVTREDAVKLKEAGEKQRQKADKRNLYLLREGIILPNTPAAELLSTAEVEKRTMSFNARKKLLQSNPSLFISKTRLSIRQIPLFVTERSLRKLAVHAIRAFNIEYLKGSRPGLTEDELTDPAGREHAEEEHSETESHKPQPKKKSFLKKNSKVRQAKIVRQQDRVDPVTGKGRSKGYGFLELDTHANALRVLRWANNNPDVLDLFREWWKTELSDLVKLEKKKPEKEREKGRLERLELELEKADTRDVKARGTLIIEFSIENVQVVQRRAARQKDTKDVTVKDRPTRTAASPKKDTIANKEEERPSKKQRKRQDSSADSRRNMAPPPAEAPVKNKNPVGSIIGKKRKQRKLAKKGHS
ncbi:hypothetical protein GLOTRDRAFT_81029 [Gloeophyllum trabeum ATCC 11539]|uniref:RRM domain-containing protein n=1 Tax=Gloeophyllum trabeum (strain ATCC 11539 / FP-39264 / Madison 617) TaxID=670483 RepID=S7PV84_GLOTA|nr:uncharacterized protein GLOTRDRAFT_81029 [Gloeophyllum trabeum ATCC 11539]EPQ51443.1 hypothetical protein GLOTRDRAFT_81029 [Gloeophyllum trabeum ATCC 11539]